MGHQTRRRLLQAGLLGAISPWWSCLAFAAPQGGFTHGVASGDPDQAGFIAWTRYVAPKAGESRLSVEVASSPNFGRLAGSAEVLASPETDGCAKLRVTGLEPGRWYFYRFLAPDGRASPIGRARTLPRGEVESFCIAVVSCANATSGWFNAYAHLAAREDIDLVVHLGDYLYESPLDRPDAIPGLAALRGIEPAHEIVTLADYRLRYASYRADRDLQALHRHLPFIVMMDDHESANNAWRDGAEGHDPLTEGDWQARKGAALRAFQEWMPCNGQTWARFDIGTLASLFRLETRLQARSRQVTFEPSWLDSGRGIERFRRALQAPGRTMLGANQERWLEKNLRDSVASGIAWQVLAQQVVMGRRFFPPEAQQWLTAPDISVRTDDGLAPARRIATLTGLTRLGLPYALDSWDGYPDARRRLYRSVREAGANLVALSGDSHNAWAFELQEHSHRTVGAEFTAQSVSSFGFDRHFDGNIARMAADFVAASPELVWCDLRHRGFLLLDVQKQAVTGTWHFVDSGGVRTTAVSGRHTLAVERGQTRPQPV